MASTTFSGPVTSTGGFVGSLTGSVSGATTIVGTNIDAGASGTAGSVDIFPTTASKGKIAITATDSTGNTTTTITNAAQSAAATLTIPDTNGNASFVMTAATQSIGGAKTFTAALVASSTLAVTGAITPTGGVAAAGGFSTTPRLVHTGGVPAQVSTDGTEATIVNTELYVAEVFIPANVTVTGVAFMTGGTTDGNAKVMLFNSAGARVAISASTDISGFVADTYNRVAFTGTYAAVGPATYYVGVICDTNTNIINTHTFGNFGAGKVTGLVYATEAGYATITPPSTFTTALGPIASLY